MKKLGNEKIGLVGVGNMGTSILAGLLKEHITSPSQIWVYDKDTKKSKDFARMTHVHLAVSIEDLLRKANVVLLAIKPQDFTGFAAENKRFLRASQCVISILAGLTTAKMRKALGQNVALVRAMPNLGAKIAQSMTVLCGKNKKWLVFAETFFYGCGEVVILSENKLDLVTAISGSGPAYFFHLMELMTEFGVKLGLTPKIAATLAIQTGVGATLLAETSSVTCAVLRQRVTSPKGTTAAALKVLQQKQFGKIFQQALQAAMMRSRALSRTN